MGKFKKRLSSMLAVVLTAFTFLSSVPVKATEITPNVTFVGVEHSPLVVGDSETFYLSAMGADKVQYRVFQNKIGTDKWEELTKGYTLAENANAITPVNGLTKYEVGKYKLSIWVKKADTEGKYKNKTGSYDSYYITYLNCVNKDNNNRVYTNGDMNVEKDNYVVGETVKVSGIKDISGMKDPYTYKLHIYDVNSNEWKLDKGAYRKDLSFVPDKPGTYVLDVWAMSSNSTLWAKETKLNGRMYEAWKLKVITVTEKVEEPEVNIVENGVIFGSQDANNPMQINKNVNIIAKNVAFNNVNVKGNVTVTGDYTTLNNVKVEGTLIINPGENGTVNLNNVNANTIEVLSGAANSIHFNNVNAKALNVNSKNVKEIVRVELKGATNIEKTTVKSNAILEIVKGSFGNIEILENSTKTEDFVEFRGSFDKNITVKTKATLKTAKDAKILKVVIEPENNEKIILDGNFGQVEVNKKAVVATTENTKVEKVTTNTSGVTLEAGKGSTITTLDQNGQTVTHTGPGTIGETVNPPTTPTTPTGPTSPTTYNVTSVSIDKTTASLVVGESLELTATINPSYASNKNVTWTSSNETAATVSAKTGTKAEVTALSKGSTTITVTTENGKKTDICTITVNEKAVNVTEVSLNTTAASITIGKQLELVATINPSSATNKNVTWVSSNDDIATVTGNAGTKANVTAVSEGSATITVTTEDGKKTATCTVTVFKDLGIEQPTVKVNMVTININNPLYKDKAVTCRIVSLEGNEAFFDQVNAGDNKDGLVKFQTVLNPGKYKAYVNVVGVGMATFEVTVEATTIDSIFKTIALMAKNQPELSAVLDITPYDTANHALTINVKDGSRSLKDIFEIKNGELKLTTEDILYLASLYKSLDSLNIKVNGKTVSNIVNDVLQGTKYEGKSLLVVIKDLTYEDFVMLINKCVEFKADPMIISMGDDSLTGISINGIDIYSSTDKHITREELRTVFGTEGNLSDATLNNFKGKKIVIRIGTVDYTIDVK